MKAFFLFFWFTLTFYKGFSQKIFFAKTNYSDSAAFEKNIPSLAQQVIEKYTETDKDKYYDDLFILQIVAKSYSLAKNSLDSVSKYLGQKFNYTGPVAGFLFQYKMYCSAMISDSGSQETIGDVYQAKFETAFYASSDDEQTRIPNYFDNDLSKNKQALETKIRSLNNEDSISIKDALSLCRVYCIYKVYSTTQSFAKKILAKIENAKYIEDDSVLVKMPDGGIISMTVIRNKKITSAQPVMLMYNIYAGGEVFDCKAAVAKGYVGIVANTRGKRLSPDAIEPLEHDAKDAYYIIDWISKQPWCNGKVGMYGGSYLGFAQWSAVKYLHPALKTIVPQVSVGAGIDYPMQNGVFMSYMLKWLHYVMDNKLTDDADFRNEKKWDSTFAFWYKKGASFRSLDTLEGRPNYIFQRWLQHPGYDNYWQNMTPQKEEFAKINIPILTITGYWDDDQLGAMYYYQQYHKWNKNPDYYLIIGPYDHGGSQYYPSKKLEGYTIDSVANIQIIDVVFQWFDHVLKDSSLPAILKNRVNFEVMGTNEWKHVSNLNEMHNDSITFYLGNASNGNQYPLLKIKPKTSGYIAQTVDMADRSYVRFQNGNIDAFSLIIDSALSSEKEKLIFVSEPLDKPFAISGALTAAIIATVNKKDIDIVLDLYEQTPDGKFFALNQTLQRASYAKDRTKRQLLQPGKIETINLDHTFITSKQLHKGSRIIMTIGVNKSPSWQINYGTGKDVSDETIKDAAIPLEIKWYNNSYIRLPILK